jgi:hypothetical protein
VASKDKTKVFPSHGIEFISMSGDDQRADCPFCGKHAALHVSPDSRWICSSDPIVCGRRGNWITFLEAWHEHCFEMTSKDHYRELEVQRGLPQKVLRRAGCAWNPLIARWIVPVRNHHGSIVDLQRWCRDRKPVGTSACESGLWGMEALVNAPPEFVVDICEGFWDAMAMDYMNRSLHRKSIAVALPGAHVFKKEWLPHFQRRKVFWWFDHDVTGREWSWKHGQKFPNQSRYCVWPEEFPEKYDVRDFLTTTLREGRSMRQAWNTLQKFLRKVHPVEAARKRSQKEARQERRARRTRTLQFREVLQVYRSTYRMTGDMEQALRVLCATVLSNQIPGDPFWLYLVGPPGCGKTLLLNSFHQVEGVIVQNRIHAASLVSGWQGSGKDPSLLPRFIGNCVFFPDWTEMLQQPDWKKKDAYGVLRGAFDGFTFRHFGNDLERIYVGTFTLVASVTDAIHSVQDAILGERMMKFQMRSLPRRSMEDLLRAVALSAHQGSERTEGAQKVLAEFLDQDIGEVNPREVFPDWALRKLIALAQLIAQLRYNVEWQERGYERLLGYAPRAEIGTRIIRQLSKLAMGLALVRGRKQITFEDYRILERIAFDTSIQFHADVVAHLAEKQKGCGEEEICNELRIPRTTLRRRMTDLEVLGVLSTSKRTVRGKPTVIRKLSNKLRRLWDVAEPRTNDFLSLAREIRRNQEDD